VSPTGSKTGHPFLANGPRRSTRVGEPSRRPKVTLPKVALLRAAFGAMQLPKQICLPDGVLQSLPLSLSEHLVVVSAVSNAELECPSEFRRLQAVARICSHVPPHQPPSRSFPTERGLRPPAFHLSPRRETAARQPRCFPPLGIDVHEAHAFCVHRQVLRPRGRPFDRVPLPLEEGAFALAVRRGRAFFYLTLLPDFDCVKQCLQIRRAPCGAPYRLFPS